MLDRHFFIYLTYISFHETSSFLWRKGRKKKRNNNKKERKKVNTMEMSKRNRVHYFKLKKKLSIEHWTKRFLFQGMILIWTSHEWKRAPSKGNFATFRITIDEDWFSLMRAIPQKTRRWMVTSALTIASSIANIVPFSFFSFFFFFCPTNQSRVHREIREIM